MEGEKTSGTTMFITGLSLGVIAVLMYQKLKPKPKTVNDTLAGLSVDLAQSIKQAADKGMSAKELYQELLNSEAKIASTAKKPTPDKAQL